MSSKAKPPAGDSTRPIEGGLASFPQARLTVVAGPDKGKTLLMEGGTVVIGSDPACGFSVTDRTVSRRHAELAGGPLGWRLRDLRSTNGVEVDALRVVDAWLLEKCRLSLGETELRFEPLRSQVKWPLSLADRFGDAFGRSAAMRRVFAILERTAPTDSSILFEGERGVGKAHLARMVHAQSNRAEGPLVEVDAADELEAGALERRLFGSGETGGAIREAEGGTLLLRNVTALPLALQARLLRALDGAAPARGGGVRLLATSREDGALAAETGKMKDELFQRLNAFRIQVPPLRERLEDLPLLASAFFSRRGSEGGLSASALELLSSHDYPGNVRELFSVVERLAAFPELEGDVLAGFGGGAPGKRSAQRSVDPAEGLLDLPYHDAKERLLLAFEKRYLGEHLKRAHGHVSRAAQRVGLPRQSLYRMLKTLGLGASEE